MIRLYTSLSSLLLSGILSAQVPNGGFENWTGNVPDGWSVNNLPPLDFYVVTPSSDSHSGGLAARGEVRQNPIFSTEVVPPTLQIVEGVPVTENVPSIGGWYKFAPTQSSTLFVVGANVLDVNGNITGFGVGQYSEAQSSYTQFTVPIDYSIGGTAPAASVIISFILNDTVPAGAVGSWFLVDDLTVGGATSGIEDDRLSDAGVGTPYPSPFATRTSLSVSLSSPATVRADVVDLLGRPVATLADGHFHGGEHELVWEPGAGVANGVYLIRVADAQGPIVRRVLLQR